VFRYNKEYSARSIEIIGEGLFAREFKAEQFNGRLEWRTEKKFILIKK
jgi:hypothetical protein